MTLLFMLFVWGCLGIAIWFAAFAAFYASFTVTYLVAAWSWQVYKKGRALWKRT